MLCTYLSRCIDVFSKAGDPGSSGVIGAEEGSSQTLAIGGCTGHELCQEGSGHGRDG